MEATRRELLGRGGIALGAAVLAGVPGVGVAAGEVLGQAVGDEGVLRAAVALEQLAVVAYQAIVERGVLGRAAAADARLFRRQEQEHVDVLTSTLEAAGGKAPQPPVSVAQADRRLADLGMAQRLGRVRSDVDAVAFAIALEMVEVAVWREAQAKLQDRKLLAIAAQILANEAQHATVWRSRTSAAVAVVVPSAFEHGASPPG